MDGVWTRYPIVTDVHGGIRKVSSALAACVVAAAQPAELHATRARVLNCEPGVITLRRIISGATLRFLLEYSQMGLLLYP